MLRKRRAFAISCRSHSPRQNMGGWATRDRAIGLAAIMPDATMFIGVDPDKAFRMMELDFREGNPTKRRGN